MMMLRTNRTNRTNPTTRTNRTNRTRVCLLAAVASLPLLSACGGPSQERLVVGTPKNWDGKTNVRTRVTGIGALAQAPELTASARTFHTHMSLLVSTPVNGRVIRFTMTGDGATDLANHRSVQTMDLRSVYDQLGAAGGLAGAGQFEPADFTMEARVIGTKVFLRMGLLTRLLKATGGSGKPWLVVDATELCISPEQLTSLFGCQGASPEQGLQVLQGLDAADATEVGPEEVKAEPVTHYHATIDLTHGAAKALTSAQARQLEALTGGRPIPVDG